jgi:hypothetical protein
MEEVVFAVEEALKSDIVFKYITFSGNGAAVLHPEFPTIVKEVHQLRNRYRAGTPIAMLSNSTGWESEGML